MSTFASDYSQETQVLSQHAICYPRCKICGSDKLSLTDRVHLLAACAECEFVFAAKCYSSDELNQLYSALYSEGGEYDRYYASTFRHLVNGKTPWIGFERRAVLRQILRRRARVIGELGAGLGMTAQYVKSHDVEYHGLEFTRESADIARKMGFNISVGDHNSLKRVPRDLDALVAFEVLEHVPDIRECLENIRASLKPGGLLGLTVPNYNRRLNDPRPEYLGQVEPPVHLNFWTMASLQRTLELCGFSPIFMRVRKRPNLNLKRPSSMVAAYWNALFNKYHGPQMMFVAQKL